MLPADRFGVMLRPPSAIGPERADSEKQAGGIASNAQGETEEV